MEAEAEAVDGRLKEAEAEAKEKLTTVPSLVVWSYCELMSSFKGLSSGV